MTRAPSRSRLFGLLRNAIHGSWDRADRKWWRGTLTRPRPPMGSSQYFEKLALSKARATQTVRVLKGDGVDSQSFIVEWYGDIRPIASNETEDGRQLIRRVEIVLYARI
jgi:hypothetical protein